MAKVQEAVAREEDVIDLPERNHAEGCPMDDDRIEWDDNVLPVTGRFAGLRCRRVRCADCGGETLQRFIESEQKE